MPNIWHIYHTKLKKYQISDVLNPIIFTTCEQLQRTEWCGISFNHFLFFFSLPSLYFSSSDITLLHSFLLSLFFLLNLIVFLSDITLSFFFSPFSSFTPISVAVVFFFCSDLIPDSTMGGLRW